MYFSVVGIQSTIKIQFYPKLTGQRQFANAITKNGDGIGKVFDRHYKIRLPS